MQIDGSYGEGGGQILRTSLSLSAITGRRVEIANIRAGRSRPGLQPQHLAAVNATAAICSARLAGAAVGSQRLLFAPESPVQAGDYRFAIGTAGAAPLVLQTVFVPLALADGASSVEITGGTHVPHAPPADYVGAVYLRTLARCGHDGEMSYDRAGFFPRGGGLVKARIPGRARPRPAVIAVRQAGPLQAFIVTAQLPEHVSERGAATVASFMRGVGRKILVERLSLESPGPGAAVVIACGCAGFTALGERGKPMEEVAEEACRSFMEWWKTGAAVDEHLADQLALPMSLVDGESVWTTPQVTDHVRTVLWTVSRFLPIDHDVTESAGLATVRLRGHEPARS